MAAFNSLGHIALMVRDLDASIAFYEKLGFPEFLRLQYEAIRKLAAGGGKTAILAPLKPKAA